MQRLVFDYFKGIEAEQYSFYRVPKVLFTSECFKSLSCEAKVLYGLMLDRMGLSIKNRWFDEEDRVYIIFTVEDIAELMNCGTQKAVKLMKELDVIGLIEKKRLGLGRPNVIYVKNFMLRKVIEEREKDGENSAVIQNSENHNSAMSETIIQDYSESQFKNSEYHNSRMVKTTIQQYPKSQFKNSENHSSGIVKSKTQEFPKSQSNKTDITETDLSETDIIGGNIPSYPIASEKATALDRQDMNLQRDAYRQLVRKNIDYQCHAQKDVDELVELMVEVMTMPEDGTVRIAGVDKPVAVVKNQFMKLNYSHIEYVLFAMSRNTTKVGNIKAYLLTALYNAPMTINNYYKAEVNHDMYGGG